MNVINQATNYISSTDRYEPVITVNITCMMVLASVYLSVSSYLPSTPVIKPVEVWLLYNLAYPFFVIIINVVLQVVYYSPIISPVFSSYLTRSWKLGMEGVRSRTKLEERNN